MAAAASEREETTPASLAQSGLALYRKYRPATFAEVKGQEHVTGPLTQALRGQEPFGWSAAIGLLLTLGLLVGLARTVLRWLSHRLWRSTR